MKSRVLGALSLAVVLSGACSSTLARSDLGDALPADLGGAVPATFTGLYASYFGECVTCHAPGAPGRTIAIETSLDFSTRAHAYASLQGSAMGLASAAAACNGVPFVVAGSPEQSLVVATLDATVRAGFASGACDASAVTDEAAKVGTPPSGEFVAALREWIRTGARDD